jgi:hypothetical protein
MNKKVTSRNKQLMSCISKNELKQTIEIQQKTTGTPLRYVFAQIVPVLNKK